MKKGLLFFLGFAVLYFASCVSIQDRTMPPQERTEAEILGIETVKFTSAQWIHIVQKDSIKNKAFSQLRSKASEKYQGLIDIRNVVINGSFNALTIPANIFAGFLPVYINIQTITATGEVVRVSTNIGSTLANKQNMGTVLENINRTLVDRLPNNSTIAVLNISSQNRNDSEFIVDELEYRLVNSGKFAIVDRRRLDQIRSEQNFQMSGDVDDKSAVSIGNMLGANIAITGSINNSAGSQWFNVKAIDVKTAQIIAMAREQL
jgi:hypothetical protein